MMSKANAINYVSDSYFIKDYLHLVYMVWVATNIAKLLVQCFACLAFNKVLYQEAQLHEEQAEIKQNCSSHP